MTNYRGYTIEPVTCQYAAKMGFTHEWTAPDYDGAPDSPATGHGFELSLEHAKSAVDEDLDERNSLVAGELS